MDGALLMGFMAAKARELKWENWSFEDHLKYYVSCLGSPPFPMEMYEREVKAENVKLIPYYLEFKTSTPPTEINIVSNGKVRTYPIDPTPGQLFTINLPLEIYTGSFAFRENPIIGLNAYYIKYLTFFKI